MDKLISAVDEDERYLSEEAEAAGMTNEAYREFRKQKRELDAIRKQQTQNQQREAAERQMQQWYR